MTAASLLPHAISTLGIFVVFIAALIAVALALKFKFIPMGMAAIEMVTVQATAPSTTFSGAVVAGDTLTVRDTPGRCRLLTVWGDHQAAGNIRLISPKLHDNVQGIRLFNVASTVEALLTLGFAQELTPNDVITAQLTGSATAGDIESLAYLVHYDNLPGNNGVFIDRRTLEGFKTGMLSVVENTLALGTAGGHSGEEAINAEFDQFHPDRWYALVGYLCSAECANVGWRGQGTGNLRVGGPGSDDKKWLTSNWFALLSDAFGLPCIPCMNANGRGAFLIDGVQDENGTDVLVSSIFVELSDAFNPRG